MNAKCMKLSDQPVVIDGDGRPRFRANAVVEALLEAARQRGFDMNELARGAQTAPQEDWEQFYQLIGYSVSGYHELSRVSDAACERATVLARIAAEDSAAGCRDHGCALHVGVEEES